jgi:uncharacterized protein YodC (DUF2158 family)
MQVICEAVKTFKAGDVVRLNSGGPNMTVASICGSQINCSWFTPKGLYRLGLFNRESLTLCPSDDPPSEK